MAKLKTTLGGAAALVLAALAPAPASASDYHHCKRSDKDAQVVGGLVGGLLGAVAGHEIADRGETTEGAVIGGLLGAAAGAGVGDGRRNCTAEARTRHGYDSGYTLPDTTIRGSSYRTVTPARVHNAHYPNRRGHNGHRHGYGHDYGHGYAPAIGGFQHSWDARREIERLKAEDRRLKRETRNRFAPRLERRRDEIRWEVRRLKEIEDQLKRVERRRDARWDRPVPGYRSPGHYKPHPAYRGYR